MTKKLKKTTAKNQQQIENTLVKKSASPHDRFFKGAYSKPKFVLEIFKLIFSKEEFNACNWKKLKTEKDSFKDKRADLVFSVPLKKTPKTNLRIFILLEHKSSYDPQLFTQLLNYQTYIHEQTLKESGRPQPVIPVLFYHGKTAWKWKLSFQEAFFGEFFAKIPVAFRKNMLNYKLKLLDVQDPKVKKVFKDKRFKSRGILSVFGKIWSLKMNETELMKALSLFDRFSDKDDDLILNLMDYFKAFGMSRALWKKVERSAVQKGIFQKGGYMDIKEHFKEEGRLEGIRKGIQKGRQEGIQKGRQEVILNMLKKKADIAFISQVTGLSEKEIKKLKDSSK